MGLEKPYNGAWQEIESVNKPVNGAWQECEAVCKPKDGAWEEIWNAILYMKELANTLSSNVSCGYATSSTYGEMWSIFSFYEGDASGYVTYYLEGDFSNPTVSFGVSGFFNYETSSGTTRYATAGTIELYTRTTDGTANYTTMGNVGSSSSETSETFEETLSGEYDRIGIRVTLRDWNVEDTMNYLQYNIDIWNFLIDGKACIPSKECVIN